MRNASNLTDRFGLLLAGTGKQAFGRARQEAGGRTAAAALCIVAGILVAIENVRRPLVAGTGQELIVPTKGQARDLGPLDTSTKFVNILRIGNVPHANDGSLVRGRGQ